MVKRYKIAIASDHAGYSMKQGLLEYLKDFDLEIKDFGAFSEESTDYADYAHPMATAIEKGEYDFGIALCGSGNGINMTVNKHQGIRSALCWIPEISMLARSHNDANVCALPARFITLETAQKIVNIFLTTPFEGGRHKRRVDKIACR
jgi:ribose 5-phosphate isomerase B